MIRFVLIVVFLALFLVLSLPLLLVFFIMNKIRPGLADRPALSVVQFMFRFFLGISGTKVTILGQENIPRDQAVLYIGNHRSDFDILLTYANVPGLTGFVAKKEMLKVPILSYWMKLVHCLFLDRTDLRQGMQTILNAIEEVKKGISIVIYPEGTRNRNESELDFLEFHEGSFKIASRAKCPIIPVAITNSAQIWEAHKPAVRPCHVIMEFGEPIYPGEMTRQEQKMVPAYTRDLLVEMVKKNQADI